MTVKIPPSLLDEAFTDRLDGLDIDSNEGRRALFMVIPRKHPLVAFLQQKKSRMMFLLQEVVVQLERLMGGYCMQIPATQ